MAPRGVSESNSSEKFPVWESKSAIILQTIICVSFRLAAQNAANRAEIRTMGHSRGFCAKMPELRTFRWICAHFFAKGFVSAPNGDAFFLFADPLAPTSNLPQPESSSDDARAAGFAALSRYAR